MNELELQQGEINITDTYFDFHQSYNRPDINEHEVILSKVMADKLMEYKFAKKLGCGKASNTAGAKHAYKSIMNQRGQTEIYKKSQFDLNKQEEDELKAPPDCHHEITRSATIANTNMNKKITRNESVKQLMDKRQEEFMKKDNLKQYNDMTADQQNKYLEKIYKKKFT